MIADHLLDKLRLQFDALIWIEWLIYCVNADDDRIFHRAQIRFSKQWHDFIHYKLHLLALLSTLVLFFGTFSSRYYDHPFYYNYRPAGYQSHGLAGGYGSSAGGYGSSAGGYGSSAGGYGSSAGAYGSSAGGYGMSTYGSQRENDDRNWYYQSDDRNRYSQNDRYTKFWLIWTAHNKRVFKSLKWMEFDQISMQQNILWNFFKTYTNI